MTAVLPNYELLDFGGGRRLERFGDFVLDRPALGTEDVKPARRPLWQQADARYEADRTASGAWSIRSKALQGNAEGSPGWSLDAGAFSLGLRLAPSGQVGAFAEQAENWTWIADRVRQFREQFDAAPRVLNLFAYTGGSTLAAAAAGAAVAHVDSSSSVVNWARENADSSGLGKAPVRWLVEDARKFVQREIRRGNTYQGIILDPPSYGHGGGKRVWKIDQDLEPLLAECLELSAGELAFLLLTAHTPEFDAQRLAAMLREQLAQHADEEHHTLDPRGMALYTSDSRRLFAGSCLRLALK